MTKTIYTSFGTNYIISITEDGTYEAYNIAEPSVKYVIDRKHHWKYLGSGKKYMNNGTKLRILRGLYNSGLNKDKADFIHFYEVNNISPKFIIEEVEEEQPAHKPSQGEDTMSTELTNKLLEKLDELSKPSQLETQMIEAIIAKGKDLATEDLKKDLVATLNDHIKNTYGALPTRIEVTGTPNPKPVTGIFHNMYDRLLKMVHANVPTMLVGPAGSGKNHTLEQIAEALDLDFYFTNAITQEHKLTGFVDAYGKYHETEFYKAFKNGGMFFFDEMDASIADALIIVNAAIANGYFDFPHERIRAHEDFRIVAAANTFGHGADMIYVGRSQLDGATLDRFAVVEFTYDKTVEQTLAQDDDLYTLVKSLRNAISTLQLRYTMSTRAIINSRKMVQSGLSKVDAIQFGIVKSISEDDMRMIRKELNLQQNDWTDAFLKCIR